jgi:Small Multidrug Resistance protein
MAWLLILSADVFEVAWPFVLKWSATFSRWSPFLAVILFTPSAFLLAYAVKQLPAATVYAAFTGVATRLMDTPPGAATSHRFPSGVVNQRSAVVVAVHAADDVGWKTSYGNQR